ncbi:hypothetical protein [Streptomyces californicus]|uniref:hypothetical protein n=1 Tax=Streptomyces californicus TaxID=67351 RepID=UPI0037B2920A
MVGDRSGGSSQRLVVACASHSSERGLTTDELVARELTVQALWCFTRHIQQMVEAGQGPSMPERYGRRFLRAQPPGAPPPALRRPRNTS